MDGSDDSAQSPKGAVLYGSIFGGRVMTESMSFPSPSRSFWSGMKTARDECRRRWTDASQKTRTRVQVVVLLVAVIVAYNYSLSTLLETANQQTPLAYVGLVPAIALALAAIRARPIRPEPPIYDRHINYTMSIAIDSCGGGDERTPTGAYVRHVLGLPDRSAHPSDIRRRCRYDSLRYARSLASTRCHIVSLLGLAVPLSEVPSWSTERVHKPHAYGHAEDCRLDPLGQAGELARQYALRCYPSRFNIRIKRCICVLQ